MDSSELKERVQQRLRVQLDKVEVVVIDAVEKAQGSTTKLAALLTKRNGCSKAVRPADLQL